MSETVAKFFPPSFLLIIEVHERDAAAEGRGRREVFLHVPARLHERLFGAQEFGEVLALDVVPAPETRDGDVEAHLGKREREHPAREACGLILEVISLATREVLARVLDVPPRGLAAVDEFLAELVPADVRGLGGAVVGANVETEKDGGAENAPRTLRALYL